jgi:hypothetical protein
MRKRGQTFLESIKAQPARPFSEGIAHLYVTDILRLRFPVLQRGYSCISSTDLIIHILPNIALMLRER